jgi:hypothetical protein
MVEANTSMNREVSIFENTAGGISPDFNSGGCASYRKSKVVRPAIIAVKQVLLEAGLLA